LRELTGECFVISVSGSPLVGKSSLLNLLLSLFNTDALRASQKSIPFKEIYKIGDGNNSTTEIIDMFCLPIEGKNYIFLDVEGDNDPKRKDKGDGIFANIIQTAVSVSHAHIYNYKGLAQMNFLNCFKSINRTVNHKKIHPDFQTKYFFLKRDHEASSPQNHAQELDEIKSPFKNLNLENEGLDYSISFLPTPPKHIKNIKSRESCLNSPDFLCETCQKKLFTTKLFDIHNELDKHLKKVVPFQNGEEFVKTLELIMEINAQELELSTKKGYISDTRSQKWMEENLRIKEGLLEADTIKTPRILWEEIEKMIQGSLNLQDKMNDHKKYTNVSATLAIRISRMKFILPELIKFVECQILNDLSLIWEEEEKILWNIFISPFRQLSKQILVGYEFFIKFFDSLDTKIKEKSENLRENLEELVKTTGDVKCKSIFSVISSLGAVGGIGAGVAIGKGALVTLAIPVGAGVGIAGVLITALSFKSLKQAKKVCDGSKKELVKKTEIDLKNNETFEETLQRFERTIEESLLNLKRYQEDLEKISSNTKKNFELIYKIEEAMKKKIKGVNLSETEKLKLRQAMKAAQENVGELENGL